MNVGDLTATLRLIDQLSGPVKSAAAAAQSAFAGMQSSSAAATGAMSQTQQRLKADLKAVEQQIRELEQTSKTGYLTQTKGMESARAEAAKLQDMIGRLGSALKAEEAAANASTAATQRHSQAQDADEKATRRRAQANQDVVNGMRAAGDALTIGVSVPLAAATAASIHFASQFETNTTRLVTLSGVSEDNMQRMKQAMLEMAPAVGVGPGELSKAMLAVTSTGLRGAEALDVLKIAAKASAVGLGDTEIVSRTVVSAMNAYGSSNLSAARAADVLYRTVVAGNAEASTLAPVLGRVTGIAAQMGISFEEVGASIATFTRLGVGADVAVTGLRDVLVHLLSPSKEASKVFAEFGLTAAGVRKELAEQGLMATLQHLMQITGGNVDVISEMLGDVRGLALVLGTAGAQADTYAQVLDEIKNGTMGVNDAHERMKKTSAQIWKEIQAQLEVVFVTFGEQLLPVLKDMAPALKTLLENVLAVVKTFADLPQPVQTFIEAMIGLGIIGGPVLSGLARLLTMWKDIRIAILGAKAAEAGIGLTGLLGAAGAGAVGTTAVVVAGGMAYSAYQEGPGSLTNASNGLGLERQTGFEGPQRPTSPFRPGATGLSPEIEQLVFGTRGALTPMGNSGVGMVAGAQATDIVGGLEAIAGAHEKASAEAKKHAKHVEEYANASKDYLTVVSALGDALYEGIAYDKARGVSTAALADVYKVSETVIDDVVAAEKTEAALAKQREDDLKRTLDRMEHFRKVGEDGAAAVVKGLGGQTVLRDLMMQMAGAPPIAGTPLKGLNERGADGNVMGLMPDGSGRAQRRMFDVLGGSAMSDTLHTSAAAAPQIILQAFTGGGGVDGALNAIGGQFGSGLMGNIFGQAGKSGLLKNMTGMMGELLGAAMPIIGSLIGPAISALAGLLHKPEYKKVMKDVGRDYGVDISEGLAKAIEATEKDQHVGRNEATLLNLNKIIGEAGGLNAGNLGKFEAKLRDAFVGVQTGALSAAQATEILDENFAAFATAATDKTGLLDGHMRELIALNQQFGTDSKEIATYLKGQAHDVAEGFNKVALGFAKPLNDAWDQLMKLNQTMGGGVKGLDSVEAVTTAKYSAGLLAEMRTIKAEIADLEAKGELTAKQTERLAQLRSKLPTLEGQFGGLDKAAQTVGAKLDDVAQHPERFESQGALAGLALQNQRASGMGMVDAYNAIGPGLDALAKLQHNLSLPADAALTHMLAMRDVIAQHPEIFAATDGLKSMATGLANSNQMTPEAFATIAREALRNIRDMEGLGLGHGDALDASKETLQVLYELQRRDPTLKLAPEMQRLVDEAKDAGLVGDKQLSAAERSAHSLSDIKLGIDELIHKAGGTVPGSTPPTGPGTGTTTGPDGAPVPPPIDTPSIHDTDGREHGAPIPMAAGGDFLVSRPTLFLAGEAGLERATFSGAGKTTHGGGAPQVTQYTSYAITVNVKDNDRARSIAELLRQDGVEILVEEIEDGRHATRLERALSAVRKRAA